MHALLTFMSRGDNFICASELYGGTISQLKHSFKQLGIEARMFEVQLGSAEAPLAEAWEERAPHSGTAVTADAAAGWAWGGWLGAKSAPARAVATALAPPAAVQLLNEGGTYVLRHATPPAASFNRVAHTVAPVLLSTLGVLLLAAYRASTRQRSRSRRTKA